MDNLNDKFKEQAEGFSLIPSPGIWKNVEADIRQRKRKKRFIIFFFLFAGMLAGGLFLFNNYPSSNNTPIALQKDIVTLPKDSQTQENTSANNSNLEKEKEFNSQKKVNMQNTKTITKTVLQKAPSSEAVSSSVTISGITSEKQTNSNQNQPRAKALTQMPTTAADTNASAVLSDSSKQLVAIAVKKHTLQTETQKDPLLVLKFNTLKQDNLSVKKDTIRSVSNQKKLNISIGVAPALSYTKIEEEGDYQFVSNYRDSTDKNSLTWNYHLAINYKLIPNLDLFTGIGIINFEQQLLSQQAVYFYNWTVSGPLPINKAYYNINGDSSGTVKNKFLYIEIPIGVRYNFLYGHKFNISLQPEISFNKLIHAEGYRYNYQTYTYSKIKSSDLKPWLVSYGVGLPIQYTLRNKFCLEFTPYYKFFNGSIYNSTYSIKQKFQQFEFRLSIGYLIK